jgi:hypothetical protein
VRPQGDPAALRAAAALWSRAGDDLSALPAQVERSIPADWLGTANQSFLDTWAAAKRTIVQAGGHLGATAAALQGMAAALEAAQAEWAQGAAEAARAGLVLQDDGSIAPYGTPVPPAVQQRCQNAELLVYRAHFQAARAFDDLASAAYGSMSGALVPFKLAIDGLGGASGAFATNLAPLARRITSLEAAASTASQAAAGLARLAADAADEVQGEEGAR